MSRLFAILNPKGWAVLAAILAVIVLAGWWVWTDRARNAERAAKAEAANTFAGGRAKAGADAVGVVTGNADRAAEIDNRVEASEDAIRNAAPADRDAAALRELCRSKSARLRPECAVQ